MFRKVALVSLAVVMVLAITSMASAKPNVADTSKKGSLLVFPKVVVWGDSESVDAVNTYIFIGNDQTTPTWVKCYWMDNNQSVEDFHFFVTANQPVVFTAGQGDLQIVPFGDNATGSLVCWAQDENDQNPRNFNHLYGHAMISGGDANIFYNAYSFALNGSVPAYPASYELLLNGTVYDACPKYLITYFSPSFTFGLPDLTLWPCKQDLRQDRIPTCTKAKFDIWNGHEVKFTGAYQCFKCFFEGFLQEIGQPLGSPASLKNNFNYQRGKGFGGEKFSAISLATDAARLRVQAVKSTVCYNNTGIPSQSYVCPESAHVDTPLLGLLLYGEAITTTSFPLDFSPKAGHTLFGAGQDTTGFIRWDPSIPVAEKPPF